MRPKKTKQKPSPPGAPPQNEIDRIITASQRQSEIAVRMRKEIESSGTYAPDVRYRMLTVIGDVILATMYEGIAEGIFQNLGALIEYHAKVRAQAKDAAADVGVNTPVTVIMATPEDIERATAQAYGLN